MDYLFSFRTWITLALGVSLLIISCEQPSGDSQGASPRVVKDSSMMPAPGLKVGYINSVELLSLIPEASAAEKSLQNYAAGQEGRFQKLAQQYQEKVADAQQRGASMTPMEQRVAMREISELEQQLQEMQAGSQERMARRREELLAPVLAKADSIVKAVARENGYDLIYDAPALMYADSSFNVMPLVKQTMGLAPKPEAEGDSTAQDSSGS
jgi:outer membrane protein